MSDYTRLAVALLCTALLCAPPLGAQPLPDPMRPPGESPAGKASRGHDAGKELQLSAIRITREQRHATINGKVVTIGDTIGAAKVTEIRASSVTLLRGGKSVTVSLLPLSIKKPVEATQP